MLTLVATHGRDNPFGNKLQMGREFEDAVRVGLDRVAAAYAMNIPFRFAFYGDLWRPDGRAEWEGQPGARDFKPSTSALEIALASELLHTAGVLKAGEKGFWDSLTSLIAHAEKHLPGVMAQGMLEHFARDTAEYFTFDKLRELTIERVAIEIEQAQGPVILLAHSMGTIVGYDLLVRRPDLPVRAYITFGSPLGFQVVLKHVGATVDGQGVSGSDLVAPFPPKLPRWVNVYNQEDLVASEHLLSPFYRASDGRKVEDVDTGNMRPPTVLNLFAGHNPDNYLSSKVLVNAIRSVVDADR